MYKRHTAVSQARQLHKCPPGIMSRHAQVAELSAMLDVSEKEHAGLKSQLAAEKRQAHNASTKVERLTATNHQLQRDKVCRVHHCPGCGSRKHADPAKRQGSGHTPIEDRCSLCPLQERITSKLRALQQQSKAAIDSAESSCAEMSQQLHDARAAAQQTETRLRCGSALSSVDGCPVLAAQLAVAMQPPSSQPRFLCTADLRTVGYDVKYTAEQVPG